MNSATVKVPDTDAKKFNIKEGAALMDCIFYEIVSICTLYKYLCHTYRKVNISGNIIYLVVVFPIAQKFQVKLTSFN